MVTLTGGPWDGQRMKFQAGLYLNVVNAWTGEQSVYVYEADDVVDGLRTIRRAVYKGTKPEGRARR